MKFRLAFSLLLVLSSLAIGQNPFAPPRATLHYALDRTCDLQHVRIETDVDWAGRAIKGRTVNTLSPLRPGIQEVTLHAGPGLEIQKASIDGSAVSFRQEGRNLIVKIGNRPKGKPFQLALEYVSKKDARPPFGSTGDGWHWIQPREADPNRIGFWVQGWPESNSEWAPTWDYPNDLATSETLTTVPAEWDVIGNGNLISTKASADKKRKTVHWQLMMPHATYLITLCGGPFDVKQDTWEGVGLWYVVPRGSGPVIDDSFGDTKDMLSFFSGVLGVKYPWPKYAQSAMYDFGGGMENVSATTLGEGSLTEAREGFRRMSSLNSHELAHQWFGDLVNCKDWGDVWLNESFATYMQAAYFEHSQGQTAYQWQIDDDMRAYFGEARRYKRPISTKLYPDAGAMLDSHSYPKGASVLHTLRQILGDETFWGAIGSYLKTWKHTAVESAQLKRAITEFTGIEMDPFWAQWIEKPGHPVLDYSWTWKPDGADMGPGTIVLTVKQLQDTKDGTPLYDIWTEIGYVREGLSPTGMSRAPIHLTKAEETFEIRSEARAHAVLLDPEHKFLREIPTLHWASEELAFILISAPWAPDRQEAMNRLLAAGPPSDSRLTLITSQIEWDTDAKQPAFRNLLTLAALAKPELRGFWTRQLNHANFDRRAQAVQALGRLAADPDTTKKLRDLVNDRSPIQVAVSAVNALAAWDAKANKDIFEKAAGIKDFRGRIKRAADEALKKANS